jgi:hypothetical protein
LDQPEQQNELQARFHAARTLPRRDMDSRLGRQLRAFYAINAIQRNQSTWDCISRYKMMS